MNIDKDDPRVLALAEVVCTIRPEMTHALALAYALAHAHVYARDYARVYALAHAHAHDYAPFTDEEKAQIDAAHALLFT
jgi:hypothetical protein